MTIELLFTIFLAVILFAIAAVILFLAVACAAVVVCKVRQVLFGTKGN